VIRCHWFLPGKHLETRDISTLELPNNPSHPMPYSIRVQLYFSSQLGTRIRGGVENLGCGSNDLR